MTSTVPASASGDPVELGDDVPTALYRLFDGGDTLLYVGITEHVAHRFQQHAALQRWWPEVARKTVQWYNSRPDATEAERIAISEESPRYNIAGSSRPPRRSPRAITPHLPPGAYLEQGTVADHVRELLQSGESHAEVVLRIAAAFEHGGRIPRGQPLARLADTCGVSKAQAYRALRKQDAADRLHGVESHPWAIADPAEVTGCPVF